MAAVDAAQPPRELGFERPGDGTLRLRLGGRWRLSDGVEPLTGVEREVESGGRVGRIEFAAEGLADWDSGLLTFLARLLRAARGREIEVDPSGLPEGVRRLLELASAVPEQTGAARHQATPSALARLGSAVLGLRGSAAEMLAFVGEACLALARFAVGRARYRRSDLALAIQQCGAQALPIVSMVSFLVGLILAFVGAVQLQQFGAQIFVADLVGLGMAREMGAMMTAVLMAGRTGASFAAELGTMTVNEEIDALETSGIPPMEFLVLPRMLALILMMPLLCLYADLLGILGGSVVGVGMLKLGPMEYYNQTVAALGPTDFAWGVVKAAVYGTLVALAGCLRGMQCGRSAAAVGTATTSAVVTSIVLIVIASGVLNFLDNVL